MEITKAELAHLAGDIAAALATTAERYETPRIIAKHAVEIARAIADELKLSEKS
jgi:predicted transcriptional regulator